MVDDRKWSATFAFVRAGHTLRLAITKYGVMSSEVGLALKEAERALAEFKKAAKL